MSQHFHDKNPLEHVLSKKAEGRMESHGDEIAGAKFAFADSLKDTSIVLFIVGIAFFSYVTLWTLIAFGAGWVIWKTGRVALIAWSRLERLHRLIEQEKFEIETHRPQEREELAALYQAKGFEGKLLEDVLDVLMADSDRLLTVMLEEEMGLTLEVHEHPLREALGAFLGSAFAVSFTCFLFFYFPLYGILVGTLFSVGLGAILKAKYEHNRVIASLVWHLSAAALAGGAVNFLLKMAI